MSKKFICCLLIVLSGLSLAGRIDKSEAIRDAPFFEEIGAPEPDEPEEPEEPDEPDED